MDVEGGGVQSPFNDYLASITESFPRVSRKRVIESSISSRRKLDVLPVNLEGDNGVRDSYIEFRIPGVDGQLLDLSTLSIDMKITLSKEDGTTLTDVDHVVLTNGLSNTFFKSCTCYLNEQMVESNALYNYHSFIKMVTTISPDRIATLGRSLYYFKDYNGSKGIIDTYTDEYFTGGNKLEKEIIKRCKQYGVSLTGPLLLDLASLDAYLLDGTDVRIRLEMANKAWVMNTHLDGQNYKIKIDSVRLLIDRVIPHASAIASMNNSLLTAPMQYTYNRTLYKTYILGSNQTNLLVELPFSQIIPQNLYMAIVDMNSMNGAYDRNGLYFQHADLSNTHITINGSTVYNIHSDFPNHTSSLYYATLETLGLENDHTLAYDGFVKGRTICAFNFIPEDIENGIPLEKSGNMRISLTFKEGVNANRVIIFFANTTGVIEIDAHRHVRCIVRA
ncbi:uncharacterized protein LOC122242213 [Penaeus japonicus]|uniref:uncharacterized protein LOC122242213 n=1 Tax=Penaeus japonicus TaxID=27405 RepID=UPI001C70DC42|nr:uncharacterized protein LOC122242213 [Penaeus japonicus]